MKINATLITIFLIVITLLFITPFLIYGYYFYDLGISRVNANWGSFGSFLSGFFSFFTAIFTLVSVLVLVVTFKNTITFNQQQIRIAQIESELNNFNFVINLIHKNTRENRTLTKLININGTDNYYEKLDSYQLGHDFSNILGWSINKIMTSSSAAWDIELSKQMIHDENLEANINKYARKYAYDHITYYTCLNNIYPLVRQLCLKIIESENNQASVLKGILSSAIDENILFWSLAIINDDKFDSFMEPPRAIRRKFEQD